MRKYFLPALMTGIATVLIAFSLRPLGILVDAILTQLTMKDIKIFLVQAVIALIICVVFLSSLIIWLLKKYHYKKSLDSLFTEKN